MAKNTTKPKLEPIQIYLPEGYKEQIDALLLPPQGKDDKGEKRNNFLANVLFLLASGRWEVVRDEQGQVTGFQPGQNAGNSVGRPTGPGRPRIAKHK